MELFHSTEGWPHRYLVLAILQDAVRREDSQLGNWIKKIGLRKNACAQHGGTHACMYLWMLQGENALFSLPFSPRHEVPERHKASDTQTAGEVSCASFLLQS